MVLTFDFVDEIPTSAVTIHELYLVLPSSGVFGAFGPAMSVRTQPGQHYQWKNLRKINTMVFTPLKKWQHRLSQFPICDNLPLHLVKSCVYLRWLALTCDHFHQTKICSTQATCILYGSAPPTPPPLERRHL